LKKAVKLVLLVHRHELVDYIGRINHWALLGFIIALYTVRNALWQDCYFSGRSGLAFCENLLNLAARFLPLLISYHNQKKAKR
jgi:hypothetical protein